MPVGKNGHNAKLNKIRRLELRQLYFAEGKSQTVCAELLGVTQSGISRALKQIEAELMKEAIIDKTAAVQESLIALRSLYENTLKDYRNSKSKFEDGTIDDDSEGNPVLLHRALETLKEFNKLLGLYPKQDIFGAGEDGKIQTVSFILHPVSPDVENGDNH